YSFTWNGVPIDARIAFRPETITVGEIMAQSNVEKRRVLLERFGVERFVSQADVEILDKDCNCGGERRLLRVRMAGDEDLVCLSVLCPSTGGAYIMRVPPWGIRTCAAAAAWIAGFDDPSQYNPVIET